MIEARRSWLENASNLISDLRQKRVHVEKMFPSNEHLRPLSRLAVFWRGRVKEFFTRDPAHLISLNRISALVTSAKGFEIEEESYQLKQLKEAVTEAKKVQRQIREFIKNGSGSYDEAKFFYGQLIATGVKFPEAAVIRDIVGNNIVIERHLVEPLTKEALIKLQKHLNKGENIDPGLAHLILEQCVNYEELDTRLKTVLSKTTLDFKDLNDLEDVDKFLRKSKLQLPSATQFADLFGAFSWVIKTSLDFGIRAPNLSQATALLKSLLETRLLENPVEISNLLAPLANIQFSIPPIREFVEWAKVLLWRANVKSAFIEEEIDLATVEELVTVAPRHIEHYHEAFSEFTLVEGVLNKAKEWRRSCNQFTKNLDSIFNITNPNQLRQKISSLYNTVNFLRASYLKEDLKLIKNLTHNYEQLKGSEKVIGACDCIAKMLSGEMVHLNDFLTTIEIIEKDFKDDKKYSMLMHQFQKIQREIIPCLEQLNKASNAMGSHSITPRGIKLKSVIEKQSQKVKVFDLDYHLERLNSRLILGDFGTRIKKHLKSFFEWEQEAKTLINQNSIKSLLDFTTEEQVELLLKKSKELRRNLQTSNLFSDLLPDLIAYGWSLKVINFLKIKPLGVKEAKKLNSSCLVKNSYTKKLHKLVQDQICSSRVLIKFCEKVRREKPTNKEVEKLREPLRNFRINLPKNLQIAKQYIVENEKIREKIDKFFTKSRPRLEVVETLIATLKKESVLYDKFIKRMSEKVKICKQLVRVYKRKNSTKEIDRQKLLRKYKKLNICNPEFESMVREKELDQNLVEKYENLLQNRPPNFKEIETLEMEIELVDDFEWANKAKTALFKKKVRLMRDAIAGRSELLIDLHDLKNLGRDGFHLSENKDVEDDIRYVEEILRKSEKRRNLMKRLPIEKVRKLKKMMFNCINISKEITDIKHKLQEKHKSIEITSGKRAQKQEGGLGKMLVKRKKQKGEVNYEVRPNKKEQLKAVLKENELHIHKKVKRLSKGIKKAILETNKEKGVTIPAFSSNAPLFENSNILNSLEISKKMPLENTGAWGIFEGTIKLEVSKQDNDRPTLSLPELKLISYESWHKIRGFPQLPTVPTIRDEIDTEKLNQIISNSTSILGSDNNKILPGMISCSGLARLSLQSLRNVDKYHCLNFGHNSSLIFIPVEKFESKWFGLFEYSEEVKDVDCDFYWILVSKETENQNLRIQPFVAKKLSRRDSQFEKTIGAIQYSKEKDDDVSMKRKATSINDILNQNEKKAKRRDVVDKENHNSNLVVVGQESN